MNWLSLLKETSAKAGNCACMGLDPVSGEIGVSDFLIRIIDEMKAKGVMVSAFKPNIGYFVVNDKPFDGLFSGSLALAEVIKKLDGSPIILDAKRGDIATSSANYASEAFDVWNASCVTVSPYMGTDSVEPFLKKYPEKGIYVLNRTSNSGARDLQNLILKSGEKLYMKVARQIVAWNQAINPSIGAVVGAVDMKEFEEIAEFYASYSVSMLIPGVGSQGGSAKDVMQVLKRVGYPLHLARVNSSSSLTHPWVKKKEKIPSNWLEVCLDSIKSFTEDLQC